MYELRAHYHHSYKRFTTKDGSTIGNDGMTFDKYKECLTMTRRSTWRISTLNSYHDWKMISIEPWRPKQARSSIFDWSTCSAYLPLIQLFTDHYCFLSLFKHRPHIIVTQLWPQSIYYTARYLFTQIHQDGCGTVDSTTVIESAKWSHAMRGTRRKWEILRRHLCCKLPFGLLLGRRDWSVKLGWARSLMFVLCFKWNTWPSLLQMLFPG
jgi:hypothetical protein